MGHIAQPRYRKDRDAWYVQIGGKRFTLARGKRNRDVAFRAFHALMVTEGKTSEATAEITVVEIANKFLAHCDRELDPSTLEWYKRHLTSFCEMHGERTAKDVRPKEVTSWLADKGWSQGNRRGAITAVKRLYRWGKKEGYLTENPLSEVEKPPPTRREIILTDDQIKAIMALIPDREFRELLFAIWSSGARPGEVYGLRAEQIDLKAGTWTVKNKTRRKTGKKTRTIYLTPQLVELSRELMARHPEGLVFPNTKGTAWTRHTVAHRFERLRPKLDLGPEATAHNLRHVYITDGLENGVPIATMAELVGHSDTTMISRVYSKLAERREHLKDAARKVRPDPEA